MNITSLLNWCKELEARLFGANNDGRAGAVSISLYTDQSYDIIVECGGTILANIFGPGELDTNLSWQYTEFANELAVIDDYLKTSPRPVFDVDNEQN